MEDFIEDILDSKQVISRADLVMKYLRIEGIPTGVYADRSSYGNRPTLALILDGILPCQAFSQKVSQDFFQPKTVAITRQRINELLGLENPVSRRDPEFNNEYLALAASAVDSCVRNKQRVTMVGLSREDKVFEFFGLKTPSYSFAFYPTTE